MAKVATQHLQINVVTGRTYWQVQTEAMHGLAHFQWIVGNSEQALLEFDKSLSLLQSLEGKMMQTAEEVDNFIPDIVLSTRRKVLEIKLSVSTISVDVLDPLRSELHEIVRNQNLRLSLSSISGSRSGRLPFIERQKQMIDTMFVLAKLVYARPDVADWLNAEMIVREVYDRRRRFLDDSHVDVIEAKGLLSKARKQLASEGKVPHRGTFTDVFQDVFDNQKIPLNSEDSVTPGSSIFCGIFCF